MEQIQSSSIKTTARISNETVPSYVARIWSVFWDWDSIVVSHGLYRVKLSSRYPSTAWNYTGSEVEDWCDANLEPNTFLITYDDYIVGYFEDMGIAALFKLRFG